MDETTLVGRVRVAVEGGMSPWAEGDFNALALDCFRHQCQSISAVRSLAEARGRVPGDVSDWRDVPAVPTAAFKRMYLFAGGESAAEFRTSGTSGFEPGRAAFSTEGLDLMAAAIRTNAQEMLLPDGRSTRVLILAPPPKFAPHMIMAWGMEQLRCEMGLEGSRFLVGKDGLDTQGLVAELAESSAGGPPLTLIGASFGFVHLFEAFSKQGLRFELPEGSRAMDAGGFKGRSREVTRAEMTTAFSDLLGIPAHRCVNLLGMTELASQFYDNVLRDGTADPRFKVNPPWTRTVAIDPATGTHLPAGETGLLLHVDLANIERPSFIQTDDLGTCFEGGGFEVHGRATDDQSRGCSITVDELIRAGT